MANTFYLRIPADFLSDEERRVSWFDAENLSTGSAALGQLAEKTVGRRVVVVVPAMDVVLLDAELPTKNRQRLLKALPYALEDQFAADVESLHFALGPKLDTNRAVVAVVARARMVQWQEALYQAGIEPQSMIPGCLAMPQQGDDWALLVESAVATLRTGSFAASSLPAGELETLFRLALEQADQQRPGRLVYFGSSGDDSINERVHRLCRDADVELVPEYGETLLSVFHRGFNEGSAIDLMQGEFSRKERLSRYWRPWRAAAAMLLAFLLLQLVTAVYDFIDLSHQDEELSRQVEQIYRGAFPDARKVVNPRVQMEQHLNALQRGKREDEFVNLMSRVGPVLKQTPTLEMEAMRYRQSGLEIDIGIKGFQSLDELKASLMQSGELDVTIITANAEEGKVRGQLRIQKVGA